MYKILKMVTLFFTIAAMVIIPLGSEVLAQTYMEQSKPDAGAMVADFILLRPLGLVTLVTGFTVFVLSAPFAELGGNLNTAWEKLAVDPAEYTFKRPLGVF